MTERVALSELAPVFVKMAHRIVWCTVATVDAKGRPRTRILHPIWLWNENELVGWIATSPLSPKADDISVHNEISLTYWNPSQDTCTADCTTRWTNDPTSKREGWDRFKNAPAPVGYDPAIIPGWTVDSDSFGILELRPTALRVMPGSVLLTGQGTAHTWRQRHA
jgi:hypothetical protein